LKQQFYSNGKLLITGEYLVLDGANALALPTKFGQSMHVESLEEPIIHWKSFDKDGTVWFEKQISLNELVSTSLNDQTLNNIIMTLSEAKKLNTSFLSTNTGFKITTKLDFPRNWGLGSSSTLINNIASWAKVDAFLLSQATFGGSGYDIAAAQNNLSILYSNSNNLIQTKSQPLNWGFTDQLFFIHLNKKQNSRDGVVNYKKQKKDKSLPIAEVNSITSQISSCKSMQEFEELISLHEEIISEVIQQRTIKEILFSDYKGAIKSLGAWGGDFILATGNAEDMNYFKRKGFETILTYQEMIL